MAEMSENAVSSSRWPLHWLWFVIIVLLAGMLRFWGLSEREIWIDESCTSYVVGHWADWPGDGPDQQTSVAHKPYFWALSHWTQLLGDHAWGLRSFSVIGGCFAVIAIGLLGGSLAGPRVAFMAMMLAAVNPLLIHYSQQARVYAWWIFFSTVWLFCLQRAARSLRWRWWLASVIAAAACFFVHYHTLFFLPASVCCVSMSGQRGKALRQWLISYAVLAVVMIPIVINYVIPLGHQGPRQWLAQTWLHTPPSLAILKSLGAMLPTADYPNYLGALGAAIGQMKLQWGAVWAYSILLLPAVFMLAGLVCIVFCKQPEKISAVGGAKASHLSIHAAAWLGGFMVFGLVIMAGYSALVSPAYIVGRYDLMALPAIIVLFALGMDALARCCTASVKASSWVSAMLLVVLTACSASVLAAQQQVKPSSDTHDRAKRIASAVDDNDLIVSMSMYKWFMDYEWRQMGFGAEVVSYPSNHDRQLCWDDAEVELAAPEKLSEDVAKTMVRIDEAISQGRRVWLLAQGAPEGPRWEVNLRLFMAMREKHIDVELRDEWVGLAELKKR